MRILLLALCALSGCAVHREVTITLTGDLHEFVEDIAEKMPQWDQDPISRYERVEIATVKADIAVARREKDTAHFLEDVDKLQQDWDALCELDQRLKDEVFL